MKHLIRRVETYVIDSADEAEAKELIEDAKNDSEFTLSKYSSEHKERKAKGEVISEWIRVILTKDYLSEKEIV